jgi:uroporphyrinogen decarboxylase
MRSTGISCFAYGSLIEALGLPQRRPRVHDTNQMLALPEEDVLDALGCDVVTVEGDGCTNAFEQPERWKPYDFGGRLPALVQDPEAFHRLDDGTLVQGDSRMPPSSTVFDRAHGGQELDLAGDLTMPDLNTVRSETQEALPAASRVDYLADVCARARAATSRAVFFTGLKTRLGYPGGFPNWSMVCMTEPDYVHEYHRIVTEGTVESIRRLLPRIRGSVDILMMTAADHGLQEQPILPPELFRELYVPYYRRINETIHEIAPEVKSFMHCCGAVYDLIEDFASSGFDVLNPVQWPAGGHQYSEWKDAARRRIALWGGGVNTQATMPLGTVADVEAQAFEVTRSLAEDSGYVFCPIHNILADIPGEKVVVAYRAAGAASESARSANGSVAE